MAKMIAFDQEARDALRRGVSAGVEAHSFPAALLALAVLVVAPIALMFLLSQVRPVYVERAVMVSSAMYYLLLAAALRWLHIRPLANSR